MAPYSPPPIVSEVIKRWDEAKKHHDPFVSAYQRRERAYRGLLESPRQAAKWRHKYHPKYAFNLIEGVVASTTEMGLTFNVTPAPIPGLSMQDAQALMASTNAVEDLLRHEHSFDQMDYKQRPLFLSAAIGGIGVGKCYWNYTTGTVNRQGVKNVPVHDEQGNVVMHVPTITQITSQDTRRDNSTFEVLDPRDFVLHESAKALQPWEPGGAQYVFHRSWYSFEQLKDMERSGFFSNVDMLKESIDFSGEYADRETELWNVNRTKDLIEVLEYWCYQDGQVWRAYVGNRAICLRDKEPTPFWHGGYPFVISSSMPQLFSTKGMSDIELIAELQEMLWEVSNQSLDNLELLNNFITLVRSDVDDPDAFEWYPGARWPVDDPQQVNTLTPPFQLGEITMNREALIKGDLQNVTAASPFASGTQSGSVDQKTATGASLVMNAAQQRLSQKKWQAQQGLVDEAWMRLKNCQQFINDERLLHVMGPSGSMAFKQIGPLDIQGEFMVGLDAVNESDNRQERRAEAQQVFQLLSQAYPMSYASGTPIDLHEVLMWLLRRWDLVDEAESFFEPKQQPDPETMNLLFGNAPKVQIRATTDSQAADSALAATGNMGTTSSTATDASSPSATGGMSMSPAVMMQRALAMRGGANNAPR